MMEISFWTVIIAICNIVFCIVFTGAICYLFFLLVKALKKYINTKEVREEKSVIRKSLGEVLKENRIRCKMTHNEVMFLYSMLNDKHTELTNYAGNLAQLAIHLEELQENIQKTLKNSDGILKAVQEPPVQAEPADREPMAEEQPNQLAWASQEAEEAAGNHNQKILAMYKEGKDAVEIARELGLGVGEVRLVIGLFREEEM